MKLTLQNKYKTVVVEIAGEGYTLTDIFDELLIPSVLAFGYHKSSVDDYIAESAMLLDDKSSYNDIDNDNIDDESWEIESLCDE